MSRIEITVPKKAMPKKDPVHPCPCQDRPVNLTFKTGTLTWLKEVGEAVEEGETVCEGEVEKRRWNLRHPAAVSCVRFVSKMKKSLHTRRYWVTSRMERSRNEKKRLIYI